MPALMLPIRPVAATGFVAMRRLAERQPGQTGGPAGPSPAAGSRAGRSRGALVQPLAAGACRGRQGRLEWAAMALIRPFRAIRPRPEFSNTER